MFSEQTASSRVVQQPKGAELDGTEIIGVLNGVIFGVGQLRSDSAVVGALVRAHHSPASPDARIAAEMETHIFKRKVDTATVIEQGVLRYLAKGRKIHDLDPIDVTAATTMNYVDREYIPPAGQEQIYMMEVVEALRRGDPTHTEGDADNPNMQQWNTGIPDVCVQLNYRLDPANKIQGDRTKTVPSQILVLGRVSAGTERMYNHITAALPK